VIDRAISSLLPSCKYTQHSVSKKLSKFVFVRTLSNFHQVFELCVHDKW